MTLGYYRHPTIFSDQVVFVCEDDLWSVPAQGGIARRLTSNLSEAARPTFSSNGQHLAFVGQEEGEYEVYVMPALGGQARRLTYMGGSLCQTVGWTNEGRVIFANNSGQPFPAMMYLYTIDLEGNPPKRIEVGPARTITYGPHGGVVLGRNTADPARWKRYRGGLTGQLWIDEAGDGNFRPLADLKGNLASPMWIGNRIYFISDHEGVGNLYSCLPSGKDVRRHTDHEDFYVRNASSDGHRIVYHAGADLYLFDPERDASRVIPVDFYSTQTQRNRKFVDAAKNLQDWALDAKGESVAISSRGKVFTFADWEGPVLQRGEPDGVRYRLPTWLADGKKMVAVTDAGGEEAFIIFQSDVAGEAVRLDGLDTGRPIEIVAHPKKDAIVFSNHRQELLWLNLETREMRVIDRGKTRRISGFDWSPDGVWLAYSVSTSLQVDVLKLWRVDTGEIIPITRPVLRDVAPAFDPDGKYLYFLSYRVFDPIYDNMQFDLGFPKGMQPFLITLQSDLPSPFLQRPKASDEKEKKESEAGDHGDEKDKEAEVKPVKIDLEGIENRIIAFPVEEGLYGRVIGIKGGKVLYSRYPVEGALNHPVFASNEPPSKGTLLAYSFEDQKEDTLVAGISDFGISLDRSMLIYRAGNRLRVLKAGDKPDKEAGNAPGRKSGWIDLDRVKVSVLPGAEWKQMFREAWRLQRDQFWTADMSQIDWLGVHDRYLPLVDRISSRGEFSDLMWEMQGELGTSHAYEMGGDYRPKPNYAQAHLGAEFEYDPESDGWKVSHLRHGDPWDEQADSPLNGSGVGVKEGDILLAVNGRRLSRSLSPNMALVNLAGAQVALTVRSDKSEGASHTRTVTVKTLRSEMPVAYREWVEANRNKVHRATNGRVGYLHIPDMGPRGYAEFHRAFLVEIEREGLIVDVRFNGGGHVSPLILEKLARRRVGYDTSRWSDEPTPYPPESVLGPMVALTNENAGSDGDIFSHGFKLLGLGPLLGKRTWGGVIGIWPRHTLVDGTATTQPEFSFWFEDVGWGVENYGTDPDIEIDNRPQDYEKGVDAQLERAIEEVTRLLQVKPPKIPTFEGRPSRTPPRLPKK